MKGEILIGKNWPALSQDTLENCKIAQQKCLFLLRELEHFGIEFSLTDDFKEKL